MEKRNGWEIITDILEVCNKGYGVRKTYIVFKTNINFKLADEYIELLLDRGLLEHIDKKHFFTSKKGKQWLKYASQLKQLLVFNEAYKALEPEPK